MRAGRAYRLLVRRGGAAPALLASPDRIDHVEVVEVGSGEVVLFWDCGPREASRLRARCAPTSPAARPRSSSRAGRRPARSDRGRRSRSVILSAMAELWVCDLGLVAFREALALQERCARRARPTRSRTRCCCSSIRRSTRAGGARAPDELPLRRGLLRRAGDRGRRGRPRRPRDLPRPRPARRLPDHADRRHHRLPAHDRARDHRRARAARASRRAGGGERPTGVWAGGRKIASIGVHVSRRVTHARLRGQRRQRPRAVRVDRAVRPAGRADDLGRARDRPPRQPRALLRPRIAARVRARLRARARAVRRRA